MEHGLLAGIWLDVLAVRAEPIAELDVPHALAVRTLVAERVACASLPAAEPVSNDSATDISATPRRSKRFSSSQKILHAAREPIELRNNDGLHVACINQREQALHAGTIRALSRLAGFHDDVRKFSAVHHHHGANLLGPASSETPRSACLSVETRAYPIAFIALPTLPLRANASKRGLRYSPRSAAGLTEG